MRRRNPIFVTDVITPAHGKTPRDQYVGPSANTFNNGTSPGKSAPPMLNVFIVIEMGNLNSQEGLTQSDNCLEEVSEGLKIIRA